MKKKRSFDGINMKAEVTVLNLYFKQRLNYLAKGCGWRDEWIELERVWLERGDWILLSG